MSVVINRSEAASLGTSLSKVPSPPRPRIYDDGPLPVRASDHAPRNARIVERSFEEGIVAFTLKIGETVLEDVGLEEVLDYVSAYHLEEFENAEFKKEEELQRIADEEDRRLEEELDARRREKAKRKGVVIMSERSEDDSEDVVDSEVNLGKHGRARPSYKKLFKKVRQRRRRRKRDPATGELMSLSEDDGDDRAADTGDLTSSDELGQSMHRQGGVQMNNMELPKRRRRKRDPITGELMPLESKTVSAQAGSSRHVDPHKQTSPSPVDMSDKPKRNRRRRHPITKELMPLGWRYDPEAEQMEQQDELAVPSVKKLSLSQENEPKRRRLESKSPRLRSASPAKPRPTIAPLSAFKQCAVIHLNDSDSDDSSEDKLQVHRSPKPKLIRRSIGGAPIVDIPPHKEIDISPARSNVTALPVRATPSKIKRAPSSSGSSASSIIPLQVNDQISSSDEEQEGSAPGPSAPITSITNPSAELPESDSSESDDEDLEDDEFIVEAILEHAWSNPKTHPAELGKKPVMLYKVKWEGWDAPTWEPMSNFDGMDVVRDYQRKVGMTEHEING